MLALDVDRLAAFVENGCLAVHNDRLAMKYLHACLAQQAGDARAELCRDSLLPGLSRPQVQRRLRYPNAQR